MVLKRLLLIFIFLTSFAITLAETPRITIISPQNRTYYDTNITLNVIANVSINTWYYNIGAGNVTFAPNTTILGLEGNANITVWGNASVGGEWNWTRTHFTVNTTIGDITINVFDEETNQNISSGVQVKLYNITTLAELYSNTTNVSGSVLFVGVPHASYRLQVGGLTDTDYPYIRVLTITANDPYETITTKLVRKATGQYVSVQFVDSYSAAPISGVSVTLSKALVSLEEMTSDINGYISWYEIPNTLYTLNISHSEYQPTQVTSTYPLTVYAIQLIRIQEELIQLLGLTLYLYPIPSQFLPNDTLCFGMYIHDTDSLLTEYGIIYGGDVDLIQNPDYPNIQGVKVTVANGSTPSGGMIDCTERQTMLKHQDWADEKLYAGYYYTQIGGERKWIIREFIDPFGVATLPYSNRTYGDMIGNPPELVKNVIRSFGYGEMAINIVGLVIAVGIAGGGANVAGLIGAQIGLVIGIAVMTLVTFLPWWSNVISVIVILSIFANKEIVE